jgi:hypothetical protein
MIHRGDYRVEFSNLPQGYEVTPSKQGNNEELDSNGVSSVITVNGKDNLSADLGIYKPKYNLGDYVCLNLILRYYLVLKELPHNLVVNLKILHGNLH